MNGPQHYQEAERLLAEVRSNNQNAMITYAEDAAGIAAAQVHATLALTAATLTTRGYGESDWTEVTR